MISTEIRERRRLEVKGIVQGVGFRPFVFNLASRLGLGGFVGNDRSGVFIEVEGNSAQVAGFVATLRAETPPLARIDAIDERRLTVKGDSHFSIVESSVEPGVAALVPADAGICDDCLVELFTVGDRRYLYPFINCTHCGPRFTITRRTPYDRPVTTMAPFEMCPLCRLEYQDPTDRRFHAQPIACPACGPRLRIEIFRGSAGGRKDPIEETLAVLGSGGIVAIKGLGGFHLACDARNKEAVERLRRRKSRPVKPFAIMVPHLAAAVKIAELDEAEAALLGSQERPIVLVQKRRGDAPFDGVAPGRQTLGVMLPYTPIHYLLFAADLTSESSGSTRLASSVSEVETNLLDDKRVLVMTSANRSGLPIVKSDDEALAELADIADAVLFHDREIQIRCDDSVMRIFRGAPLPIRRSRGYAPLPIQLPFRVRPTLAAGADMKNNFCLAHEDQAFLSQHVGELKTLESVEALSQAVEHFETLFSIEPEVIASDMHPAYLSTGWARQAARGRPVVTVQHHHAHLASLMAEHGLKRDDELIGFVFDGSGYGSDQTIWGGEMLRAGYRGFRRVAHLLPVPLPGGDAGVERPYRMALAHLWAAGIEWEEWLAPVVVATPTERKVLRRQLERKIHSVETSSMGRFFDAVAALLGLRQRIRYEGEAAIELEALAASRYEGQYAFGLDGKGVSGPMEIDCGPLLRSIIEDLRSDTPPSVIAARFHQSVVHLIHELARSERRRCQLQRVGLSGGVFQNMRLLTATVEVLEDDGFEVLFHRQVPPNDGGIALGQAIVAGAQREEAYEISG